jgi:SMODS-associated and fused to various effectors sensor domain
MSVPSGYDPITLNHWLWWKLRCHEGAPEDFQKLFEEVLKRAKPDFMQIRPYGNIGDRKCDGLYFEEGVVFQVYSPDELKQSDVQAKIEEDLAGAVAHWKDRGLKKWVFVYNCRRGLAPDIPGTLVEQKTKYPWLEIDHMSADSLWEMARGLTLQQRSEILGAPTGYEHMFALPAATSGETVEQLRGGHFVVVHDVLSPINVHHVLEALRPGLPLGPPIHVRPARQDEFWNAAARYQRALVDDAITKSRDLLPRFAVFSLSPVPLAIHLGFAFSDRVEVRTFQFDRDRRVWSWPEPDGGALGTVEVSGMPTVRIDDAVDVVLRVSISANISAADTTEVVPHAAAQVDISTPTADVTWLRSHEQLTRVGQTMRDVLRGVREAVPRCRCLHLFAAVPAGAAIVLGQAINPRMSPPVALYEFSMQKTPRYERVLLLTDQSS